MRVVCGRRNRRKDAHHNTTVRVASPGPSIKSVGSREYDGNESDEKNPDVIPETMDSDQDQVRKKLICCFMIYCLEGFHIKVRLFCLLKINFTLPQVEFIRRRQQHISTIDTSSPSRLLLASNASSNSSSFIPTSASHIQIHKNNNPMGYCTLRNGSLHHQALGSDYGGNISISPVPKQFQNPSNTCTLPRGHHNTNHWPTYAGTIAGTAVRNMSQTITISQSQHQPPPPPSCLAMSSLGSHARPRVCIGLPPPPTQHLHHQSSLIEDDAETPLMLKRESSVIL